VKSGSRIEIEMEEGIEIDWGCVGLSPGPLRVLGVSVVKRRSEIEIGKIMRDA